ncbi:MAG: hypothetical protein Q9180_007553 [Flavoplaca navasiana]
MLLRPASFCFGTLSALLVFYCYGPQYSAVTDYVTQSETEVPRNDGQATDEANATRSSTTMSSVTNRTLGFEKILAVGLPERSDRRDTLTMTATVNDIKLEWVDAVKGSEMNKKAWPAHWNTGKVNRTLAELGNWRSHLNAVRRVVESGWSSALIIEDDADWDIALKSQLQNFANRTRTLSNNGRNESLWITSETATHSPYGDDWDLLYLGSCANPPAPDNSPTFPGEGGQAHWVFPVNGGMSCLYGYAINARSARTLMGWLLDVRDPTDFAVSSYCGHFRCIAVWPELIGTHKPAGPQTKDSSIQSTDNGGFREKGETRNIVHSAILDMLARFGPTELNGSV